MQVEPLRDNAPALLGGYEQPSCEKALYKAQSRRKAVLCKKLRALQVAVQEEVEGCLRNHLPAQRKHALLVLRSRQLLSRLQWPPKHRLNHETNTLAERVRSVPTTRPRQKRPRCC